jgi:hypothetical protein
MNQIDGFRHTVKSLIGIATSSGVTPEQITAATNAAWGISDPLTQMEAACNTLETEEQKNFCAGVNCVILMSFRFGQPSRADVVAVLNEVTGTTLTA